MPPHARTRAEPLGPDELQFPYLSISASCPPHPQAMPPPTASGSRRFPPGHASALIVQQIALLHVVFYLAIDHDDARLHFDRAVLPLRQHGRPLASRPEKTPR